MRRISEESRLGARTAGQPRRGGRGGSTWARAVGRPPRHVAIIRLDYDRKDKIWAVTAIQNDIGGFVARDQWEAFRRTGLTDARTPASSGHRRHSAAASGIQSGIEADRIAQAIAAFGGRVRRRPGLRAGTGGLDCLASRIWLDGRTWWAVSGLRGKAGGASQAGGKPAHALTLGVRVSFRRGF